MAERSGSNQVLVPVVGRPNVGKSTLFNRLVGEERSVVGPEPGVTRDRVSEPLTWEGRSLTLIDTAGYAEGSEGSPDPAFILEQVEAMIETGECLLFVVDARAGLNRLDRRIADKLYPHAERVILVVNKVDPGQDPHEATAEFYELGFRDPLAVSAEHGRGIGRVRSRVLDQLPERTGPAPPDGVRLALVGRPNVGKSTLFNAVLGYDRVMVDEDPGTTRDLITASFRVEERRFVLMDTVGMRRRTRVDRRAEEMGVARSIRAIGACDVAALVFDWEERVTRQDQRIAGLIQDRYRGCLLLVNKADEPDERLEARWMDHLRDRLHFLDHATVLFTSGEARRGLGAIFRQAGSIYDEMHSVYEEEVLDRVLLDVKSRLDWPGRSAQDVILQEVRQEDVNPVTLGIKARGAEGMTRRDLRHLRRLLREELDLNHVPLKLRMVEEYADVS